MIGRQMVEDGLAILAAHRFALKEARVDAPSVGARIVYELYELTESGLPCSVTAGVSVGGELRDIRHVDIRGRCKTHPGVLKVDITSADGNLIGGTLIKERPTKTERCKFAQSCSV